MTIDEFKTQLKPYRAIMGFDYGTKRIGIAVSDLLRTIATPVMILQSNGFEKDLAKIKTLVTEKEVGAFVYGLPLQMDGTEGETAEKVRRFAEKIAQHIDLPYTFWDERFSSSAVEKFLVKEADFSRQKRKKILDASAAAYILQGALDNLNYSKSIK